MSTSMYLDEARNLQTFNSFMIGLLVVSALISVLFGYLLMQFADIVPYVADGGVFGCQVNLANIQR